MTLNYNNTHLEAVQFYGDTHTGYDGEYSTRYKWLDLVIQETKDCVTVKVNNKDSIKLNTNDWIIYCPATYQVIDVCDNNTFVNKYLSISNHSEN